MLKIFGPDLVLKMKSKRYELQGLASLHLNRLDHSQATDLTG